MYTLFPSDIPINSSKEPTLLPLVYKTRKKGLKELEKISKNIQINCLIL